MDCHSVGEFEGTFSGVRGSLKGSVHDPRFWVYLHYMLGLLQCWEVYSQDPVFGEHQRYLRLWESAHVFWKRDSLPL